jgi:hypothetical protein
MILWQMAKTYVHGAKRFPVSHLGQWTKLNPLKISTSMSGLRAKELVGLIVSADAEDSYFVTDAGLDVMNELHDYSVTDFAKVRDSWRAAHG